MDTLSQYISLCGLDNVTRALREAPELQATLAHAQAVRDKMSAHTLFPADLLAHVLGYAWRDAKRIALVCKRWADLVRGTAFWARAIERSLKWPPKAKPAELALFKRYWSPFSNPHWKQREDQLGWLFNSGLWQSKAEKEAPCELHLLLKSRDRLRCCQWMIYYCGESSNASLRSFIGQVIANGDGKAVWNFQPTMEWATSRINIYTHPTFAGAIHTADHKIPFIGYLEWINPRLGVRWVGQGLDLDAKSERSIVPHGKGTWTFADGTTLSGDKVAVAGHIFDGGKVYSKVEWAANDAKRQKLE
jgi:hypothetical protein